MEPDIGAVRRDLAVGNVSTVAVFPAPEVRVNFFLNWGYVAFDIELRELVDQAWFETVCAVMSVVGLATRKGVALTPEGGARAVLSYEPSIDEFELQAQ